MQISKETIFLFAIMLLINALSNAAGTIKSIFVTKQVGAPAYIASFIDAIIYAFVLKSFSSDGYVAIIAYVLGRIIGMAIGNVIEKRIAIGVNDINLYVKDEITMLDLQYIFLDKGFSTTATIGMIDEEHKRYCLNVHVARKDMSEFYTILKRMNIKKPTMTVKELKTVTGKIQERT